MTREKSLVLSVIGIKLIMLWAFLLIFGYGKLIWSDSETYVRLARNIYADRGFSEAHVSKTEFPPNSIRTPLYPAVVGLFDTFVPYGFVFVSFLQIIAAGFIALLVYKIAVSFVSSNLAFGAAILVSFEPLISVIHMLIMPETFLVLFILLFIFYFLRFIDSEKKKDLALSVLMLALAVYTKPVALYLFIIPIVFLLFRKHGVVLAVFFLVALFLLLSPWMIRNKVVVGKFDMTTDDTGNLCGWELAGVLATKYHIDSSDFTKLYALPEYETTMKRCASTSSALKIFLTEYPLDFLKTSTLSVASLFINDGYSSFLGAHSETNSNHLTPAVFTNRDWRQKITLAAGTLGRYELTMVIAGKLLWFFVSMLAIIGAYSLVAHKKLQSALFLFCVLLYFVAVTTVSTGFGVGARLRYPVSPILVVFAGVGIAGLAKKQVQKISTG